MYGLFLKILPEYSYQMHLKNFWLKNMEESLKKISIAKFS